jgi:hypothetical protein
MMIQAQATPRSYGTMSGYNRHLAFTESARQGQSLTGRGRARGSRQRQSLRAVVGGAPDTFMLNQKQPDGE